MEQLCGPTASFHVQAMLREIDVSQIFSDCGPGGRNRLSFEGIEPLITTSEFIDSGLTDRLP
jgi:hypothetical protein